MNLIMVLSTAAALAMDAFAVAVSSCMGAMGLSRRDKIKMAGSFGLFQGAMPLVGYTIARTFASYIESVGSVVAFILLVFIGGKMIWGAVRSRSAPRPSGSPAEWQNLLVLSIATSIDALAVGASMAVAPKTGLLALSSGYLLCCLIIAAVTFVISLAGAVLGGRVGGRLGRRAEIAGGLVLIAIGAKILIEYLI